MKIKASRAVALGLSTLAACSFAVVLPASAQIGAQQNLPQNCSADPIACANLARRLQAAPGVAGNPGAAAVLNGAAAAATAAAGQTVNPAAFGASSVVTPTNAVGAVATSQQYGQCVQAAGADTQAMQRCMSLLPPEWAAMARSAQGAVLANPTLAAQAAQQAQSAAALMAAQGAARGGGVLPNANAAAMQAGYVACIQAAGLNMAAAAACAQPVQQVYGGMPGATVTGYEPAVSANAIAAAAGGYQACVLAVGVTNAAGVQVCQARFFGR